MKLNRENVVNLRKELIKHFKNNKVEIEELTNLLINYPTMVNATTRLNDVDNRFLKKKITNTGHGAFGEPEVDWDWTINDRYIGEKYLVFYNETGTPIISYPLDLDRLIEEVKVAHNESFKI